MQLIYAVHIAAGALALLSGYVALYAAKGDTLHRRSGRVFVYSMLLMCVGGTTIAAVKGIAPAINIPSAVMTSYLVITSLTTVRPLRSGSRPLTVALMLVALVVALADLTYGIQAINSPTGTLDGIPPFPFFMFGVFGILAVAGDVRVLRFGPLRGTARIARHLWRMGYALSIAAMSFFIGQAKVIPKPIRITPLLVLPVIAVIATTLYWMWRVRFRKSLRGLVGVSVPERSINPIAERT